MSSTAASGVRVGDEALRDRLVDAFKRRKGEATTADLVSLTGLPLERVEAELPSISDEYGARLRVTESGELLYSFPKGLHSRYRGLLPALKRFWKFLKKGAIEAGKFLFKAWIVVMLVGYFALFLVLLLVFFLASIALKTAARSDDSDSGGGGLGGLFMTGRLLETFINIWFYSELFKDPRQRAWEADKRAMKRRERQPLHRAIFGFVFGPPDPNSGWDATERKAVVAWLQSNKGVMTMAEFRALTGLAPAEAEQRINVYLRDFKGRPEVSEQGTILFLFPDLLRRADSLDRSYGGSVPLKQLRPFSGNKPKADRLFAIINGVNILFGGYFLGGALAFHPLLETLYSGRYASRLVMTGGWDGFWLFVHQLLGKFAGVGDPGLLLGLGLGAVPLSFAAFFYGIPLVRRGIWKRENEAIKLGNLRRVVYNRVVADPEAAVSPKLEGGLPEATPANPKALDRVLVELAAAEGGEPGAAGTWTWPGLLRTKRDAELARSKIRSEDFALGKSVFDSHGPLPDA